MASSGDRLIAGDVGQATREEGTVIDQGGNYDWPLKEGFHCHDPQLGTSTDGECIRQSDRGEPLVDPVLEFPHFDEAGDAVGFAVTGGHIHTGDIGPLREDYLFGVFTSAAGRLIAATPWDSGSGRPAKFGSRAASTSRWSRWARPTGTATCSGRGRRCRRTRPHRRKASSIG